MGRLSDRGTRGSGRRAGERGASGRLVALAVTAVLAVTGTIGVAIPASAQFDSSHSSTRAAASEKKYPSWSDVKKAQKNEKNAKALIARIRGYISSLEAEVARTERVAKEKGEIYATAQQAYDDAAFEYKQIKSQAKDAQGDADAAKSDAARSLAELNRTGTNDLTATLLTQSGDADSLLYRLGAASKLSERSGDVYEKAIQLQNAAQALTDQAKVAKTKLASLKSKAEKAFEAAQAAAAAVASKLEAQRAQQEQLQAQLAVLVDKRKATEKDYKAGVAEALKNGGVASSGWAKPAYGCTGDLFGMRYHPIYHVWMLHTGVDILAPYDAPIYAAASGRVVYAGWYGDLGYYVKIDHGGGMVTGYGHIREGGIRVSVGQVVTAGQVIAKVGATGGATGPHLHFQTYRNGGLIDPVPFMRNQGVRIGC